MYKNLIIFLFLAFSGLYTNAQVGTTREREILVDRLPEDAKIIEALGSSWYKIEILNQVLLYHFKGSQKGGYESLTKLEGESLPPLGLSPDEQEMLESMNILDELPLNTEVVKILGKNWFILKHVDKSVYIFHLSGPMHGANCMTRIK